MSRVFLKSDLQILISTKDRVDLHFLTNMFPFEDLGNLNLLIINQTQKAVLESDYHSIKVINSNQKGLSKSRNLAIKNANSKICLIADDDVIFESHFQNTILSAFEAFSDSEIITFNHYRSAILPQKKWLDGMKHTSKTIWNVSSVEIAFLLDPIRSKKKYFDENFGLGSYFESAEEFLFLKSALKDKLKIKFCAASILSHSEFSSGKNEGSDALLYARAALFYKLHGFRGYIRIAKYILFLVRTKRITINEIKYKWNVACAGISKFKVVRNEK